MDGVFDGLVDWVRSHQDPAELTELAKPLSHPDLVPGDMVLLDGSPVMVRRINFHGPHQHPGSKLPAHLPATEIVTGRGSPFFTLTVQVPNGA
ncbi:hypothetical protein [Streptomyces californicus]|uniref:hypothetical protein n=1 Tax=Streptomyces californicus TaxID=67351 RepID=UPI0037B47784